MTKNAPAVGAAGSAKRVLVEVEGDTDITDRAPPETLSVHPETPDESEPDTERRELFVPIPKHVMGDTRLTRGHHRLLYAIAWHSRFDDNGRGCYATQETLAREANIDRTNVSHFAADLARWGIITIERLPIDKRRRVYRLIFKEKKE